MEHQTERHTITAESPRVDLELQKLWDEAQSEFHKNTNRKLASIPPRKIEDVLVQLKEKFQPEDGVQPSTKHKTKDAIEKILKCIQLIGGVAAEAASTVFAPATLCFNAISFLIDIPQKVAEVYEGLGNLFEEMTHAMALLNIYGSLKRLDRELKGGIHKIMVSIVRICGLSINIIDGGKKSKVRAILKATFLKDDSGIKDELSNLKNLIKRQNHLTGVITLKNILDNSAVTDELLKGQISFARVQELFTEQQRHIADKVTYVEGDLKAKKDEKIASDRVEKISKLLSMPEGSAKANTAREEVKDIRKQLPEDAFKWLSTAYEYNEWLESLDDACVSPYWRLLYVYGEQTWPLHITLSLGCDTKTTETASNNGIVYALKSMALQLATQSKAYAAALSQLEEKDLRITDTRERSAEIQWWDKLRFAKDPGNREPSRIVLLFDGLDKLPKSDAHNFLKFLREQTRVFASERSFQLFILVTGRYDNNYYGMGIIDHTKDDINSFIEQELDRLDFLQGQDVETKQLRKSIRERLPKIAEGSFSVVLQELIRIREAVKSDAYSDDIEAILDQDPSGDMGRLPVQPLEKKLEEKFAKAFPRLKRDNVRVDFPIKQFLERSGSDVPTVTASAYNIETAKISMTVAIHQADLHSVQRFSWDLTERTGIEIFDFSPASSDNEKKITISSTWIQAHCRITEQLLKLLNEEPSNETIHLVVYALKFLPLHTGEVKKALLLGNGKTDRPKLQAIAKRIVDLLSDAEAIEKFENIAKFMSNTWWSLDNVKIIRDFIKDERTIDQLGPRERRWVKTHTKSEGKVDFYWPITLMIAKRWLWDSSRTWSPYDSYLWVDKFIDIQEWNDDEIKDTKIDSPSLNSTYVEELSQRILSRATWARKTLRLDENSLWYERIGQTFYEAGQSEIAIEYFNKAKSFPSCHWTVNEYLALAYYHLRRGDDLWRECASSELELAITALKSMQVEKKWLEDQMSVSPARTLDLNEALFRNLARLTLWQKQIGKIDRAIALYNEVLESNPWDHRVRSELLRILFSEGKNEEAKSLILGLKDWVLNSQQHDIGVFSKFLLEIVKKLEFYDPYFGHHPLRFSYNPLDAGIPLRFVHNPLDFDHNPLDFGIKVARSSTELGKCTLQALTKAVTAAENEIHRVDLLVYQGLLIVGGGETNVQHLQNALTCWKNCGRVLQVLALKPGAYDYERNAFTQLLDALEAEKAYLRFYFPESNMQANLLTSIKAFLASYYSQSKDFVKAQNLFRDGVLTAISILEDEDPDNDPIGYKSLIGCFIHTGDDRNALNAWSLLYPNDTLARSDDDEGESTRSGPLDAKCKGGCGKTWAYADDFYICKSCYQTIFCGDCLEELKGNRLKTWACHPEHSWLYVPPWNDENVAGKGMVRVMDESNSPKEVKISDWIKDLKRIWEIE
ncbi:hypothetical protein BTUL_0083g00280 [Botrytis tulipae]|uniref:Uncharacterized protein n=1 Tax=Botrytis tulipae TaxID=87230 RepID=A0A4Z1EJX8_9HELO|nr:hypothetical protein BTUL_0083g00280 [Botrytis tulipae]